MSVATVRRIRVRNPQFGFDLANHFTLNNKTIIMYTATVAALAALPLASAFVAPTGFTGNALARYKISDPASNSDHV
jgi:hypothetical protein